MTDEQIFEVWCFIAGVVYLLIGALRTHRISVVATRIIVTLTKNDFHDLFFDRDKLEFQRLVFIFLFVSKLNISKTVFENFQRKKKEVYS